jgi:peroxiredoxin
VKSVRSLARIIAALAVLALPAAAWYLSVRPAPAPEATFATIGGESLSTASLRGKVVLVNFWATSCEVCTREMPQLADLHRKHRGRGLETVAVAMSYDPPNYVARYAQKHALPFRVALDPVGAAAREFGDVRLTSPSSIASWRGSSPKRRDQRCCATRSGTGSASSGPTIETSFSGPTGPAMRYLSVPRRSTM